MSILRLPDAVSPASIRVGRMNIARNAQALSPGYRDFDYHNDIGISRSPLGEAREEGFFADARRPGRSEKRRRAARGGQKNGT
jgi:hypothetical protein